MRSNLVAALVLAAASLAGTAWPADEPGNWDKFKEGMKKAGDAVADSSKKAAGSVAHGAKKTGRAIAEGYEEVKEYVKDKFSDAAEAEEGEAQTMEAEKPAPE
ncbi:MAG: hypothetical protein LBU23_09510 [Planctomycetota bacterium]|jgi:gas vesicle protein|nr:hypothetical protein [Planctomycetota bacterium]